MKSAERRSWWWERVTFPFNLVDVTWNQNATGWIKSNYCLQEEDYSYKTYLRRNAVACANQKHQQQRYSLACLLDQVLSW